jgi:methyl-accepting chemotaxis protein
VKYKLLIAFGFIIFLLGILTFVSYRNIYTIAQAHQRLYEKDFMLTRNLADLQTREYAIRLAVLNMFNATSPSMLQKWYLDLQAQSKDIEKIFPVVVELGKDNKDISHKLEVFQELRLQNKITRDTQVIPLLLQGKFDEARKFQPLQSERFDKMRTIIFGLTQDARERASVAVAETQKIFTQASIVLILVASIALVFASFVTWFLNLIISKPLNELSKISERISIGDLDIKMNQISRKDEIGLLFNTFDKMTKSLKSIFDIVKKISSGDLTVQIAQLSDKDVLSKVLHEMIMNLRSITIDINQTVHSLRGVASELSASSVQLVDSASETATSVSETTTTLEEVRQTAQLANEKAQRVAENIVKTEEVTESGKKAAEEIRNGIDHIKGQMEAIAKSMIRLSEQTQMIGIIITTVDDLAQQSNLLAVNASIEAAKAGEQGKGFAVVAQEVKSLADQSKKATNQVRSILSDIQKATSTAVMATEQGTKAVKMGIQKSTLAGESINALADNAKDSAQSATQIAATTHQQLIGMEQTTIAMENIKEASQKNAESAKQLESAVNNINELGVKLRDIVNQFTLEEDRPTTKEPR